MHYCVFVMIKGDTSIDDEVFQTLAPFDEALDVESYRVHLDHESVLAMADHYQLDPADLLPGEMQHYGYTVGPAPTFKLILPPGMPDDDPAAYVHACRLANDHRMAAWRRLQKRDGG